MASVSFVVIAALLVVASGQIIFGGYETGRQLVKNCGIAQPTNIFFPSLQRARVQRSAPQLVAKLPDRPQHITTVVGGEPVRLEQGRWPWMVLLGERANGRRRWTCGGALISARTVLTAAHCVAGRQPSALTARLGEHDTTHTRDGQHTDVSVSCITVHPDYRSKQNDIALLQLSRPVSFSRRIQPV